MLMYKCIRREREGVGDSEREKERRSCINAK